MSFKNYFKEQLNKDEYSLTIEDLQKWLKDYNEVKEYINPILSSAKELSKEEQLDYLLGKLHHNNAYDICSDTSEPIEYIDFNYGSITCTVSIYGNDNDNAELLNDIDGYITRNGEECSGSSSITIREIEEVLNEWKVGA